MRIINNLINLFKRISAKQAENRHKRIFEEANENVVITNDKNDPENKIYIYVKGVPVALVGNDVSKDCNCISFEDAGRFVANIKNMYSKILDNEKIM